MTPDLDDAIRDSLRRHAETAPTTVDLGAVHARARALGRRRALEAVLAVATALVAVLGAGLLLRASATHQTPPPVGSASPTVTQAHGRLPWSAWWGQVDDSSTAEPGTTIWTDAGGTHAVYTGQNVMVVGWTGVGRRTLVWLVNPDLSANPQIYAQTFQPDGSNDGEPHRVVVPGTGALSGTPFLGADGRLVLVRSSEALTPTPFTVVRVAPDLGSATTQPLPAGVALFATARFVGLWTQNNTLLVVGPTSSGTWDWGPRCFYAQAVTSDSGETAAFTCRTGEVDVLDLATIARGGTGGVTRLTAPAPGVVVLSTWFDPTDGLHVFTTTSVSADGRPQAQVDPAGIATWDRSGEGWTPSGLPVARYRIYLSDGMAIRLAPDAPTATTGITSYTWTTDSGIAITTIHSAEPGMPGIYAVRDPG
jgi:hypothetical protein